MRSLQDQTFLGDYRDCAIVQQLFASVEFVTLSDFMNPTGHRERVIFTVRRFRNLYLPGSGEKPLFFLVPDEPIACVWPDNLDQYQCTKYSTASPMGDRSDIPVVTAICLQRKDAVGLYLCLDPRGALIRDEDNLGI